MLERLMGLLKRGLIIFLVAIFAANLNIAGTAEAVSHAQEEPIYIVQSGDTLNSIALRFGVSADDLQLVNDISDPNALIIGQRLTIPGLEGIAGILISTTLSLGASLINLTRQYQLNMDDLAYLNRITSPSEAMAGATFIIPLDENQDTNLSLVTVGKGQTLLEAAIRTGESSWQLIRDNQLLAAWDILPGDKLYGPPSEDLLSTEGDFLEDVSFNRLPLVQGETLQISVKSKLPVEISGRFDDEQLHFFSDDQEIYYSFHGIHALADPGPHNLQLSAVMDDGTLHELEQLVLLVEGDYTNEWVFVPEEYLDESVIAEEDAYLEPILKTASPVKHWQGIFQYPVDEPCINSYFGQRRDYNNGSLYFYHTGVDFAVCAQNLNIYAPADGEVVLAEELSIRGKAILIDHGWGIISGYWHLSEFNVDVGDFVKTGDIIGQIGNTGRSAGPHLHFEIDINGIPINPETWLIQEFPQSIISTNGTD